MIGSDKAWPLLQCLDSLEKEENINFIDNRLARSLSVPLLFPFPSMYCHSCCYFTLPLVMSHSVTLTFKISVSSMTVWPDMRQKL